MSAALGDRRTEVPGQAVPFRNARPCSTCPITSLGGDVTASCAHLQVPSFQPDLQPVQPAVVDESMARKLQLQLRHQS